MRLFRIIRHKYYMSRWGPDYPSRAAVTEGFNGVPTAKDLEKPSAQMAYFYVRGYSVQDIANHFVTSRAFVSGMLWKFYRRSYRARHSTTT